MQATEYVDLNVSRHTLIHLGLGVRDSKTLPVLIEMSDEPRISYAVAQYTRFLQREGHLSYAAIYKLVAIIGKAWDFYTLVYKPGLSSNHFSKNFIEDFLFNFDHGSVLDWKPATNAQYNGARIGLCDFLKFMIDQGETVVHAHEAEFVKDCREAYKSSKHLKLSLLFHLKKKRGKAKRGKRKLVNGVKQFKPFPFDHLDNLICMTSNPRDRLAFSMLALGGLRVSEILHLFLEDVKVADNLLTVELRHPSLAPMEWVDIKSKKVSGQRREYLRSKFGLIPRTDHGALRSSAGWKGIKFDDERAMAGEVYFIRDADQSLVALYRHVLNEVLPRLPKRNHPYFFRAESGDPISRKALSKQFDLAKTRVEKKHGVSLKGFGLHSLRHFYGFYCADVLGAPLLMIQKWMRHASPVTTAIYTHISAFKAHAILRNAHSGDAPSHDSSAEVEAAPDPAALERRFDGWQRHSLVFGSFGELGGPDPDRMTRGLKNAEIVK